MQNECQKNVLNHTETLINEKSGALNTALVCYFFPKSKITRIAMDSIKGFATVVFLETTLSKTSFRMVTVVISIGRNTTGFIM